MQVGSIVLANAAQGRKWPALVLRKEEDNLQVLWLQREGSRFVPWDQDDGWETEQWIPSATVGSVVANAKYVARGKRRKKANRKRVTRLKEGSIVALRSLGGFELARVRGASLSFYVRVGDIYIADQRKEPIPQLVLDRVLLANVKLTNGMISQQCQTMIDGELDKEWIE